MTRRRFVSAAPAGGGCAACELAAANAYADNPTAITGSGYNLWFVGAQRDTPGDSNIHIHFQTPDNKKSGHIQKLRLGANAVLSLPKAAAQSATR